MTYLPRSVYEYGDEVSQAVDVAHDHRAAHERGQKVATLTDTIVSALLARGILPDPGAAAGVVIAVLVEMLYDGQVVELPERPR